MEIKRSIELSICAILKSALSDLTFYSSRGGGGDVTQDWKPNHLYSVGDVIRPTNHALVHALVCTVQGTSGSTQPAFTDVVDSSYGTAPKFETTSYLAVSSAEDSGNPMPPFCVVSVDFAEKTMSTEETSLATGTIVWVTRADSTDIVAHSKDFKRIYDAMCNIGVSYDVLRRLMIHGLDVGGTDEFNDEARQAHGDTISFSCGVSEKPAQT